MCNLGMFVRVILLASCLFSLSYSSDCQNAATIQFISTDPNFPELNADWIQNANQFVLVIQGSNVDPTSQYVLKSIIKGRGVEIHSEVFSSPSLHLTNGQSRTLYSRDLATMLDARNMQFYGMTREEYFHKGLPEGQYTICFQLLDIAYDRRTQVSNSSCQLLKVKKYKPPVIVDPEDEFVLHMHQNIPVRWITNVISPRPLKYELLVYAQREQFSHADYILYDRPILKEEVYGNQFILNPAIHNLRLGDYILFVKSVPMYGTMNFENNGYSVPIKFLVEAAPAGQRNSSVNGVSGCSYPRRDVLINEVGLGNAFGGQFVEVFVTGLESNSGLVDLTGYILDDVNASSVVNSFQAGHVRLKGRLDSGEDCFENVPAGTMILVYDDQNPPPGISPENDGLPNLNGIYQVPFSHPCIGKFPACPNVESMDYSCTEQANPANGWDDLFGFEAHSDAVQLRKPDETLVHAFEWNLDDQFEFHNMLGTIHPTTVLFGVYESVYLHQGENWYDSENYLFTNTSASDYVGTPGYANNDNNSNLLSTLAQTDGSTLFHIECSQEYYNDDHTLKINIHGALDDSYYEVWLDNEIYRSYETNNPIYIEHASFGSHVIHVIDMVHGCEDICEIELVDACEAGQVCQDNDPCTAEFGFLDADCNCIAEPLVEVSMDHYPLYHFQCSYEIELTPASFDPNYELLKVYELRLSDFIGNSVVLNISSNANEGFHFPYHITNGNDNEITKLRDDLNNWILDNGYSGSVQLHNDFDVGLYFDNVNLSFNRNITFKMTSDLSPLDYIYENAELINCIELEELVVGHIIYPVSDDCNIWFATVEWSGGEQTPFELSSVFLTSLDHCVELSVTCENGCTSTVTGPGTQCSCVIGEPCIPEGEMEPCLSYVFDENCDCVSLELNLPDADLDGVCDEYDLCPGHDDHLDMDEDGVPDGCDLCHCFDDSELTPTQIALLSDNDPNNDVDELGQPLCDNCVCDDEIGFSSEDLTKNSCTYCAPFSQLATQNDFPPFLTQYSTYDESGTEVIHDLIDGWKVLEFEDFEDDLGSWNLNNIWDPTYGWTWAEYSANNQYVPEGNGCVLLRHRNQLRATVTSDMKDIHNACFAKVSFKYRARLLESNEGFFLMARKLDGSGTGWVNLKRWTLGVDFANDELKSATVYLPGPFSNKTQFRFRCDASGHSDYVYIDDVLISYFDKADNGDCILADDPNNLVSHWRNSLEQSNHSADIRYIDDAPSSDCGSEYFLIENSTLGFGNYTIESETESQTFDFVSEDCPDQWPGQPVFAISADIDCPDPNIEWATGETGSTIIVPSDQTSYDVTVVCGDGCVYEVNSNPDADCEFGAQCIPEDPCYDVGSYDAVCNCIPDLSQSVDTDDDGIPDLCDDCPTIPVGSDANGNGIPDCDEIDCLCSEIDLHIVEFESYSWSNCFPVSENENGLLSKVKINIDNVGEINLHGLPQFSFPYCAVKDYNVNCSSNHQPLSEFRRDFVNWALSQGWNVQMTWQENNEGNNCHDFPAFWISNMPEKFVLSIDYSHDDQYWQEPLSDPVYEINLPGDLYLVADISSDCDECHQGDVSYHWSDPQIPTSANKVLLENASAGYSVSITCQGEERMCTYVGEHLGDCIVGTECDDGDPCTTQDRYDANCNCVGSYDDAADDDADGVPNSCDACPGQNDQLDDDHDGVPNCIDECHGYDDELLYDDDPTNDPADCITCSFIEEEIKAVKLSSINDQSAQYAYKIDLLGPYEISIDFSDFPEYFQSNGSSFGHVIYCLSDESLCYPNLAGPELLAEHLSNWMNDFLNDATYFPIFYENEYWVSFEYPMAIYLSNYGGHPTGLALVDPLTIHTNIGAPCDDNDPCTVNDRWDEDCRCRGELVDTDNDGVPDCMDQCPEGNDMWDMNNNGIPDCAENFVFTCDDGSEIQLCEYYFNSFFEAELPNGLPMVQSAHSFEGNPAVLQRDLREVSQELKQYFEDLNYLIEGWHLPTEFLDQLKLLQEDENGIPNYIDPFFDDQDATNNTDGIYNAGHFEEFCLTVSPERVALLVSLSLEVVNYIAYEGVVDNCFVDHADPPTKDVHPGCADALGIGVYEDENCILRDDAQDCPIEFYIDCNGKCAYRYLNILFDPLESDCSQNLHHGAAPCELTVEECGGSPCEVWEVVPNPNYDPLNYDPDVNFPHDPNGPPVEDACMCVLRATLDEDGDGVCDDIDQCSGFDDDDGHPALDPDFPPYDNDGDGIHDCHDSCPNQFGSVGDVCNDDNPHTFGDYIKTIDGICTCLGTYIDLDGDGIPDVPGDDSDAYGYPSDCQAAIDLDGDGYYDQIVDELTFTRNDDGSLSLVEGAGPDGLPDCDVCPGLDDTEDANGDGIPDCLRPPYQAIGCPLDVQLADQDGIILIFNSDDIAIEDVPEPISVMIENITGGGSSDFDEYDYLTITNVREYNGRFEVLYAVQVEAASSVKTAFVTYANHQQCIIEAYQTPPVHLGCPDDVQYYPSPASEDLVLTYLIGEGGRFSASELNGGDIAMDMSTMNGDLFVGSYTYTADDIVEDLEGNVTITLNVPGLEDISQYSGTIQTNGNAICQFQNAQLQTTCEDDNGHEVAPGEPCDDGDDCTEYDQWVETSGDCECVGQLIDHNGDDVCDLLNLEFVGLMCPDALYMQGSRAKLRFLVGDDHRLDPTSLTGQIIFSPDGQATVEVPIDVSMADFQNNIVVLDLGNETGLNISDFNGTLTLPNGLQCAYSAGDVQSNCTIEIDGVQTDVVIGDPCDDRDDCTHHDHYEMNDQGECECIGESSPDSDGDGICDAVDACPDVSNDGNPDNDEDGYPDCPCLGDMAVQTDPTTGEELVTIVQEKDVEIMLIEDTDHHFSHIDIKIEGGPETMMMNDVPFNNPVVIPNLPFGYYYTITLVGVCHTGGQKEAVVEVDIPFSANQFVCGLEIEDIDISSYTLLSSLGPGEVFSASDFDIKVKSVSGGNGRYSGNGYIKIPFFGNPRVNVTFDNIVVTSDYQMIQGVVNVNGFGLAVLGDDISDAINDHINNILDALDDLETMLDNIIPILEAADELVKTTGGLVDQQIIDCIQTQTDILENEMQQEEPDQSVIVAATTQLQLCLDQYNQQMEQLLDGISDFMVYLFEQGIPQFCNENNQFSQFENDESLSNYLDDLNAPSTNPVINSSTGFTQSQVYSFQNSQNILLGDDQSYQQAHDFYMLEANYLLCKSSPEIANAIIENENISLEKTRDMLKLLVRLGHDVASVIAEDIKEDRSNEDIYSNHKIKIHNALKKSIYDFSYRK